MSTATKKNAVMTGSKAEINAYAEQTNEAGLELCEVPCMLAAETPGGDPKLYCEGRIYETWAVSNGYCIPDGEATIGQPPRIRYIMEGTPRIAMHGRRPKNKTIIVKMGEVS